MADSEPRGDPDSEPPSDLNTVLRATPDRLDLVLAHIARIDPAAWDPEAVVGAIDRLAAGLADSSAAAVLTQVYGLHRFRGDDDDYYDPSNSLIHRVLARRRGIPLSLAVVAAEVSRRVGGTLSVVGFPGHVLIGDGASGTRMPNRWFDPFAGGAQLSVDDLQRLLARVQPGAVVRTEMLASMSAIDITVRTLNNLVNAYQQLGMMSRVVDVIRFRVGLEVATVTDHRQLAALLSALGRHDAALAEFENLVRIDPDNGAEHQATVERLMAHRN